MQHINIEKQNCELRPMFLKRSLVFILSFVFCAFLGAQEDGIKLIEYDHQDKKQFEIGGIKVEGATFSDEKAIIALSGLQVGATFSIPGPALPKAIKNLYKRKLFTDIEIVQEKRIGDIVFLIIKVKERARLSRYTYRGVKKSKHEKLNEIVKKYLTKGAIITENAKANAINEMEEYYREKGYLDASVKIREEKDEKLQNAAKLIIDIDRGSRVKIKEIHFEGNEKINDKKLTRLLKNTKPKRRLFAKSKLVQKDFEEDKKSLIKYYNTKGYRDARIIRDSIWRNPEGELELLVELEEGTQYYVRHIVWKGNTLQTDERLSSILGINKGEVYNEELINNRLRFSLDGRDISSLYLDDGYLFFNVEAVEVAIDGDSIDLEMRIFEGPQATIDRVVVEGNDRTHDHVILRELRTRPGDKFSRANIIRSQRELMNLGYFDPEQMEINTPVNAQKGTVDIEYKVTERPSDQLELSAGWGGRGSGVFGTLGVVFNNFSLRNIFKAEAWKPLPQGDGQKFSIRYQSNGRFWRSFNFSFTEPWLGGKKPNSFTVGASSLRSTNPFLQGALTINRIFSGLGTRLRWPDDNFIYNATLTLEQIRLENRGGFSTDAGVVMSNGRFNNLSIKQTITRSTINEPIFPRSGSQFSLSVQLTPPYSLFRDDNFFLLTEEEKATLTPDQYASAEAAKKFNFLEYHKWRFNAQWFSELVGKLVLMTNIKIGAVGAYNNRLGTSPFERFELGGDGIANQAANLEGKEIIALRGYDPADLPANSVTIINSETGRQQVIRNGATIFNKYTLELRYPLSTNPNSTIYMHTFVQGGNVFKSFREFNPFNVRKSAGFGLRVFLPMFGILGFDWGVGFDKQDLIEQGAGLGQFAKFNIILGFEPE